MVCSRVRLPHPVMQDFDPERLTSLNVYRGNQKNGYTGRLLRTKSVESGVTILGAPMGYDPATPKVTAEPLQASLGRSGRAMG
ncbi:MAG: hypothetical protein L0312_08800, partial [Acidobacteria bacterium]|nr:hypothetical protein [Acidobacteriota bacterium]